MPFFGIMGAAVVTIMTFMLMMLYFMRKSRTFFDIQLEWAFVWKSVAAASAMYGVLCLLEPAMLQLSNLLHVGCSIAVGALSYFFGIWALGVISREEIAYFKALVNRA